MFHDFQDDSDSRNKRKGCDKQGLMSYGFFEQKKQWSHCSRDDFAAFYARNKYNWCLEGKHTFHYNTG